MAGLFVGPANTYPAAVADLVGDNVGDCAGMAADIFESYEVTIVSGLILGISLWHITGHHEWIVYPLWVRGIGVLCSIIGTYAVKDSHRTAGNARQPTANNTRYFFMFYCVLL